MTRWLDIAWSAQGVHEVAGAGAAPEVLGFFRDVDRSDITSDEIAWCAAFAGSCLGRAGVSLAAIPKAERLMARSYLKIGRPIDKPRVGCIAVTTRGDPTSWTAHVFFVVAVTPTHVVGLGGNQANAVTTQHFARSSVIGYRWPGAPVTAKQLDTAGSRITTGARAQTADSAKAGGAQLIPDPLDIAGPLIQQGQAAKGQFEGALDLLQFASGKWPWLMLIVSGYFLARVAWRSELLRKWRAEDASTGAHTGRAGETEPVDTGMQEVVHVDAQGHE